MEMFVIKWSNPFIYQVVLCAKCIQLAPASGPRNGFQLNLAGGYAKVVHLMSVWFALWFTVYKTQTEFTKVLDSCMFIIQEIDI